MIKEQYLKQLDLKKEDLNLNILEYSPKEFQLLNGLKNVQGIDPRDTGRDSNSDLAKLKQPDQSFDLVLCSHFLFTNQHLSEQEHLDILLELVRLGTEVRIYPVTDKAGKPSPYLGPMIQALQLKGFGVELRQVQVGEDSVAGSGAGAVLVLWQESCALKLASRGTV